MAVFIWTAKVHKGRIALTLALALAVCGVFFWGAAVSTRGAAVSADISPKGIKTEADRVDYLAQWGWLTSPEAVRIEELELPREFGPEYESYLALQSDQGFDLTKYAGKRVKRYTYDLLNYPGGVEGVQANLLLYKNTVVGGEVQGDGILHGLEMPG